MKARINRPSLRRHVPWVTLLFIAICLLGVTGARAGLTMTITIHPFNYLGDEGYNVGLNLNTNNTPPNVSFGNYFVVSPGYPNGNVLGSLFQFDTNGFNQVSGGVGYFTDFDSPDPANSLIQSLTNGQWSIFVTNATTTNVYYFTVTATIGSNAVPLMEFTYPTNDAGGVPNQPTLAWDEPTNYNSMILYGPSFGYGLPPTQTSFTGVTLNDGLTELTLDSYYEATNGLVSSVPLDTNSNPISSWVSTWSVWDETTIQFTVGPPVDTSGTTHTLVAHYTWDTTNADGSASGADSSGNGYNMNFSGSFGAAGGESWTPNAIVGPGAIQFDDGDGNSGGYAGWSETPTNVLAAIAGSFTVSCWVNTTQSVDNAFDYAYNGVGIVSAYTGSLANDVIPLALNGGEAAFNTGGNEDDTLTSYGSVNDGNNHLVVVTRNQLTGQKIIYIDGVLDTFGGGTTNLLTDAQLLTIGSLADAADPYAADAIYYNGYAGILDDLQIYSGVLSSNEVATLYANPGTTIPFNGTTLAATASPQSGPEPLTVQFASPGVDSAGNTITNWTWSFGDGGTSTAQNPLHTYGNLGSYSPSLTVQSSAGYNPAVTGPGVVTVTMSQAAFLTNLPGSPAAYTFDNFSNASSLQFNGSVATANTSDGAVLELTKSGSAQTGSAFSGNPITFTHNVGFSTFFAFRLGGPASGSPGDSITFTIQTDGPSAEGGAPSGARGMNKSMSVEFDAFNSGTQSLSPGGINANQVAIWNNGAGTLVASEPVATPLDNGNIWYAWVDYEGVSQDLEVRLSEVPVRPLAPTLDTTVNLPGILSGNNDVPAGPSQLTNLLVNGDFEDAPNWNLDINPQYRFDSPVEGWLADFVTNEVPGWTVEPGHAIEITKAGVPSGYGYSGFYGFVPTTISGDYSVSMGGGGYNGHNSDFYQDFSSIANASCQLSFNWQTWLNSGEGYDYWPATHLEVSVTDTVTGAALFDGLYWYDGAVLSTYGTNIEYSLLANFATPVHLVTTNFVGTGNPLRLRVQENPESGAADHYFGVDNFSVSGAPQHVSAYVGFTGSGGNQQDILDWKFMPLPTTRITGVFTLTNTLPGFQFNNGLVLVRYTYTVAGTAYTNYTYAPINTVSNANAQLALSTGIAELAGNSKSALAGLNPNAIDIAVSNNAAAINEAGNNNYAVLGTYQNADLNVEGAVLCVYAANTGFTPSTAYYANNSFENTFNMNEMSFDTLVDTVNPASAKIFPGLFPPSELTQIQTDNATYNGPNNGCWLSTGDGGVITGDAVTYSYGTAAGTMTARTQVIDSPPLPLFISSVGTDGTNFNLEFGTILNQDYTVWASTNLATTNWVICTNLLGDGYIQEINVPLTNSPQSFFQLSSP